MIKLYHSAFGYLIAALLSGLFYREFTKIYEVQGVAALGTVHTHLFALGFMMFLLFLLLESRFQLINEKRFGLFFGLYHTGVILTAGFMLVRGICNVLAMKTDFTISGGLDASISGMAGLGHIILTIALIIYMVMLKKKIDQ
ncbi:MAG: DUF2871 domain-containing protein [Bacillus sp. (in: firmicutes)]